MTSRSPGTSSVTSYVYSSRRPMNRATKATRDPTARGGGVSHSTRSMFSYQAVALSGSAAYPATASRGRATTTSLSTSTATEPPYTASPYGTPRPLSAVSDRRLVHSGSHLRLSEDGPDERRQGSDAPSAQDRGRGTGRRPGAGG